MRWPKAWMYISHFSRLNRKPRIWHLIFLIPFKIFENLFDFKKGEIGITDLIRQFNAIALSTSNKFVGSNLPNIELLCVAAGKDLELLPFSINQAVTQSGNPILKITIITPFRDIESLEEILKSSRFPVPYEIINEDLVIRENLRNRLQFAFGQRYGWVLQQLLAVSYILESKFKGVLLIDADTILLRKMDWLAENSKQILMVSTEFHKPYYELLSKIIATPKTPPSTFVTHHMLFQPHVLQEIFSVNKLRGINDLVDAILKHADMKIQSPLCIEFELYAQGLLKLHPELVELRKFANKSWPRNSASLTKIDQIIATKDTPEWNSISLHDYL